MCGIVGYLNLNGSALADGEDYLEPMCASIIHRGPDEEGRKILGPVALGMTRLSIIDLATGSQPIANEDGSVWIVFNGEIYNFQELQQRIASLGHSLSTASDTETIVHLYEDYGVDCLKFLEGMFAFALWDSKRRRLFIARDRLGEKPLHWGIFNGQLIFGSEIKSILCHPGAGKELDPVGLQKYLALEYVPAPHSIFKGIEKLAPAHYMLVENGKVKIERYWEPRRQQESLTDKEAAEKLLELLGRSVSLRLISDVPLGVFLSGGIDSSSIAALASSARAERLKTFSIGFSDRSFDESAYAQAVARQLGAEHHEAVFTPGVALATMEELWRVLDEPLADASIIPTYFLAKMTRQSVTVALSGEGGDELFGGYPTYQAHQLVKLWRLLPPGLRRSLIEPALRHLPVSLNNLSVDYKVKRFIAAVDEPAVSRHFRWMGAIPLSDHGRLLSDKAMTLTGEEQLYPGLAESLTEAYRAGNGCDLVSMIMHMDMVTYLPDDLLVKSDRASMAASLECRLPFLAYPLVEFAVSLPSALKVRGMTTKYLLKKAMGRLLPKRILNRPKKGFGIPVGKWINNEFKPVVAELLEERFVRRQELFQWPYVERLLGEHRSGRFDRRKELWTLLMFQWWWRKFFGS